MIRYFFKILFYSSVLLLAGCGVGADDGAQTESGDVVTVSASEITVYKSPTCGCCKEWVTYLEEEGFSVSAIDHDNVDQIKIDHGLPSASLRSCHTAIVDGYIVEGHVPASDILRLLDEKPEGVLGISAPGMPMMSPGMGSREPKDYDVVSFTKNGEIANFSQY